MILWCFSLQLEINRPEGAERAINKIHVREDGEWILTDNKWKIYSCLFKSFVAPIIKVFLINTIDNSKSNTVDKSEIFTQITSVLWSICNYSDDAVLTYQLLKKLLHMLFNWISKNYTIHLKVFLFLRCKLFYFIDFAAYVLYSSIK